MYSTKSLIQGGVDDDGKISVKIQYPDTTTTRMQLSPDMKLQEILTTICYQQVLHVDKHTLIIINNGKEEDPRMDKPLGYYKNIQKILVKYSGPAEGKWSCSKKTLSFFKNSCLSSLFLNDCV